jgi:hypothetical protein
MIECCYSGGFSLSGTDSPAAEAPLAPLGTGLLNSAANTIGVSGV